MAEPIPTPTQQQKCEHADKGESKYTDKMRCCFAGSCRHQVEYVHEFYCNLYDNPKEEREPRAFDFGRSIFERRRR